MRHFALALAVTKRGKTVYVPVLYVQDPTGKELIKFLGAHSLNSHTEPKRRISCGEKSDANAIALKFANGYNDMTGSHKVKYVTSIQRVPRQVKEFLQREAKKL